MELSMLGLCIKWVSGFPEVDFKAVGAWVESDEAGFALTFFVFGEAVESDSLEVCSAHCIDVVIAVVLGDFVC